MFLTNPLAACEQEPSSVAAEPHMSLMTNAVVLVRNFTDRVSAPNYRASRQVLKIQERHTTCMQSVGQASDSEHCLI